MEVTDHRYTLSCSETVKKRNSTSGEGWTSPPSHIRSCTIWNMLTAVLFTAFTLKVNILHFQIPMDPSILFRLSLSGMRGAWSLSRLPMGERRGTPRTGCLSDAGWKIWMGYLLLEPHCIHGVNSPSSLALKFVVTRVTQQPNANKKELLPFTLITYHCCCCNDALLLHKSEGRTHVSEKGLKMKR